jgi:hypothetical protein
MIKRVQIQSEKKAPTFLAELSSEWSLIVSRIFKKIEIIWRFQSSTSFLSLFRGEL